MPAGVRVQQLTPIVRAASNQPATFVRLMSPGTSTIRSGIGQQQIFQLNTNKQQQQPVVIKTITTSTANRQQQHPILLTTNPQSKTILPQTQQQVFVLNPGQAQKLTLQLTNKDQDHHASTTDNHMPQLDGAVDDQVKIFPFNNIISNRINLFQPIRNGTPGMFKNHHPIMIDSDSLLDLQYSSSPISQPQQTSSE